MFRYLSAIVITLIFGMSTISQAAPATSMAMATKSAAPTKTKVPTTTTTITGVITAIARVTRLRVRDAASLKTKVLFMLTRGQNVNVLGVNSNKRWLKIRTADGQVGWVSLFYMRLVGGKLSQLPAVQ